MVDLALFERNRERMIRNRGIFRPVEDDEPAPWTGRRFYRAAPGESTVREAAIKQGLLIPGTDAASDIPRFRNVFGWPVFATDRAGYRAAAATIRKRGRVQTERVIADETVHPEIRRELRRLLQESPRVEP